MNMVHIECGSYGLSHISLHFSITKNTNIVYAYGIFGTNEKNVFKIGINEEKQGIKIALVGFGLQQAGVLSLTARLPCTTHNITYSFNKTRLDARIQ